jgi:hypothetical protein
MENKKKAGRKGKYETHVKPFFDKIEKLLNETGSEKNTAASLGVSYATWNNYKKEHPELDALCKKPRVLLIEDLRSALVKRALGFTYEEKKQYITEDEDGHKKKHTEITTKQALPDTTAIFGALNIYDPEYVKDKKAHELKEQELELRRQMAEEKNW